MEDLFLSIGLLVLGITQVGLFIKLHNFKDTVARNNRDYQWSYKEIMELKHQIGKLEIYLNLRYRVSPEYKYYEEKKREGT